MIQCAKCGSRVGVIGPCRTCAKAAKYLKALIDGKTAGLKADTERTARIRARLKSSGLY